MKMWFTSQDTVKFELTPKETKKYNEFKAKCDKQIAEEQHTRLSSDPDYDYLTKRTNGWKEPYMGALGGGYSITFSPNNIHRGVLVRSSVLNIEEDITDYDAW